MRNKWFLNEPAEGTVNLSRIVSMNQSIELFHKTLNDLFVNYNLGRFITQSYRMALQDNNYNTWTT